MSNIVLETKIRAVLEEQLDVSSEIDFDKTVTALIKALIPEQKTRIERLTAEHEAMSARHQAMKLYMMTDTFKQLDRTEKYHMDQHSRGMAVYLSNLQMLLDYYGVHV